MENKELVSKIIKLLGTSAIKEFFYYYQLSTGKKITRIEQILEVIAEGSYTVEDMFYERMNHIDMKEAEAIYWEDNMEMFSYKNYFDDSNDVGEGAWIKIRTERGYEVHYAKKSGRIHDWGDLVIKELRKKEGDVDKVHEYMIRRGIGMQVPEVFYYNLKNKRVYVQNYQYELYNIDDMVTYIMDNCPHITTGMHYTSNNSREEFYIRTRGISKKMAEIMADLKQCYFQVDIVGAMDTFNNQFKSKINGELN